MQSEPNEHKVIDLLLAGWLLVEDGNHGEYRPRPNELGSGKTAFIRAADMEGGRILFESADKINDVALARIRKGIGRGGDILFSHKGTVGKLAIAPLDAPPFVCSPQTTFWRTLDEERLDRRYLYYFMCSRRFWEQWHSRKGETDMADYVSLTAQRELFVAVPHIDEQRAIALILGALDDKIELNRQMNRTLEAIAQALFKSWFLDFDPVTAKAAGRKPYGINEETAALFPDRFMESELGLIPEGWRVKQLGELIDVIHGYAFQGEFFRTYPPGEILLTPGNFKIGGGFKDDKFKYYVGDVPSEYILQEGDLLITMTDLSKEADSLGYPAIVPAPSNGRFLHNQRLGKVVIKSGEPVSKAHLYFLLCTDDYRSEILASATGTTVKHTSPSRIKVFKLPFPPNKLSIEYGRATETLLKRLSANEEESRTLAALRDTLLPKLLSGEIRVREAEREMEQVV